MPPPLYLLFLRSYGLYNNSKILCQIFHQELKGRHQLLTGRIEEVDQQMEAKNPRLKLRRKVKG